MAWGSVPRHVPPAAHVVWRRRIEWNDRVVNTLGALHGESGGGRLAVVDTKPLTVKRQVAGVARNVVHGLLLIRVWVIQVPSHVLRRCDVSLGELRRVTHAPEADGALVIISGGVVIAAEVPTLRVHAYATVRGHGAYILGPFGCGPRFTNSPQLFSGCTFLCRGQASQVLLRYRIYGWMHTTCTVLIM